MIEGITRSARVRAGAAGSDAGEAPKGLTRRRLTVQQGAARVR